MIGAKGQRIRQLAFPGGERLAGPRVDQVEADAVETALRRRDRAPRLILAVRAAQKFKNLCVKALNAYRNAIDPGGGEVGEIGDFDRIGVRLERDFDIVREAPQRVRLGNRSEESRVGKEWVSTCKSRR